MLTAAHVGSSPRDESTCDAARQPADGPRGSWRHSGGQRGGLWWRAQLRQPAGGAGGNHRHHDVDSADDHRVRAQNSADHLGPLDEPAAADRCRLRRSPRRRPRRRSRRFPRRPCRPPASGTPSSRATRCSGSPRSSACGLPVLLAANGLNENSLIVPGQQLNVPQGGSLPTPQTTQAPQASAPPAATAAPPAQTAAPTAAPTRHPPPRRRSRRGRRRRSPRPPGASSRRDRAVLPGARTPRRLTARRSCSRRATSFDRNPATAWRCEVVGDADVADVHVRRSDAVHVRRLDRGLRQGRPADRCRPIPPEPPGTSGSVDVRRGRPP